MINFHFETFFLHYIDMQYNTQYVRQNDTFKKVSHFVSFSDWQTYDIDRVSHSQVGHSHEQLLSINLFCSKKACTALPTGHTKMIIMKSLHYGVLVCCLSLLPLATLGEEGKITTPSRSLIETTQSGGWNFALDYTFRNRDLSIADSERILKEQQLAAYCGYELFDFLNLQAGAGWVRPQLNGVPGKSGFALLGNATASLAEYIIEKSPVLGKQQSLGLLVSGRYIGTQSEIDDTTKTTVIAEDQDFKWHEFQVIPMVRYYLNLEGPENWAPYDPTGYDVQAGVIYDDARGDLGASRFAAQRKGGLYLGLDMRFTKGWVFTFNGSFYSSSDLTMAIGSAYYF